MQADPKIYAANFKILIFQDFMIVHSCQFCQNLPNNAIFEPNFHRKKSISSYKNQLRKLKIVMLVPTNLFQNLM